MDFFPADPDDVETFRLIGDASPLNPSSSFPSKAVPSVNIIVYHILPTRDGPIARFIHPL